jgi:hypothetical protein
MEQELTAQCTQQMTQDLNGHPLLCRFLDGPSVFLASHCISTTVDFRFIAFVTMEDYSASMI